ncbi:unnamed protein product [Closterium sp. Yama58-4]|nr:unnamed protein product [Closterium sp. Yama58-4]
MFMATMERRWRAMVNASMPEARGDIRAIIGQPFFVPLFSLYLVYGGVFRLSFGPKRFVIVSDPVVAKHILRDNAKSYSKGILSEILDFVMGQGLIPADGEVWLTRRRTVAPALHRKYVSAMVSLFGECSQQLCDKLERAADKGQVVEMESLFSRMTLDVIGKAVFNYEFNSLQKDTGIVEAVYVTLREAEVRSTSLFPYWKIPPLRVVMPSQRKVSDALTLINGTLNALIAECKQMVEAEEEEFFEEYLNKEDPSILHFLVASGDDVTSKQLRDDLMTMLIAGHETSAAVLTWAFYLLAQNPAAMVKLQAEVDSVLGDRQPSIDDFKKLRFTTRVINEAMRLYPQPPVLIRRALEDDVLGGYPIKEGQDIFISVWNLHHSPELWQDAEAFRPERWPLDGPDPTEVTENFSYLPFGGGQRKCIGDVFATFEVTTAVAMVARRFDFSLAPGAEEVGMTTGATIHTTNGLLMAVSRRTPPPAQPVPSNAQIDEFSFIFDLMDRDRDGRISATELASVLESLGEERVEETVQAMMSQADTDGDGYVDFDEFIRVSSHSSATSSLFYASPKSTLSASLASDCESAAEAFCCRGSDGPSIDDLAAAFELFDRNKDGFITAEELSEVMGGIWEDEDMSLEECERMIRSVDLDGDGRLCFSEFVDMMLASGSWAQTELSPCQTEQRSVRAKAGIVF